ncbi:hypothetical protein TNCV_3894701 [Trichonephila clavipes]|nr:hypothetical protein TNCV_3894701 [Trichonephila clavipes]
MYDFGQVQLPHGYGREPVAGIVSIDSWVRVLCLSWRVRWKCFSFNVNISFFHTLEDRVEKFKDVSSWTKTTGLVVLVTRAWLECHNFEPSAIENQRRKVLPSVWCGNLERLPALLSSSSLNHGLKLRDPLPIILVLLYSGTHFRQLFLQTCNCHVWLMLASSNTNQPGVS